MTLPDFTKTQFPELVVEAGIIRELKAIGMTLPEILDLDVEGQARLAVTEMHKRHGTEVVDAMVKVYSDITKGRV